MQSVLTTQIQHTINELLYLQELERRKNKTGEILCLTANCVCDNSVHDEKTPSLTV